MELPIPVQTLTSSPDVVVTFTGLLLLRFDSKESFTAGVLPVPGHLLRIGLEVRDRATDALQASWRYTGTLKSNFRIEVAKPKPELPRFTRYQNTQSTVPLKRILPVTDEDIARDFRWILNLQDFHETTLQPNPKLFSPFSPVIRLNNGHFYSHKLFGEQKKPLYLARQKPFLPQPHFQDLGVSIPQEEEDKDKLLVKTVTEVVGANIYLNRTRSEVSLNWGRTPIRFPWNSLKYKPNQYYRVTFCNLDETPKSASAIDTSDLPLYYTDEGIPNVPEDEKLNLRFKKVYSTEHPCVPVLPGP